MSHQVYPSLAAIAGILHGLDISNTVGETKWCIAYFFSRLLEHGCEWSLVKKLGNWIYEENNVAFMLKKDLIINGTEIGR